MNTQILEIPANSHKSSLSDNILNQRGRGRENFMVTEKLSQADADNENEPIKIIHAVPDMSEIEREHNRKIIGNDLYEVFLRIQAELKNLESEKQNT